MGKIYSKIDPEKLLHLVFRVGEEGDEKSYEYVLRKMKQKMYYFMKKVR